MNKNNRRVLPIYFKIPLIILFVASVTVIAFILKSSYTIREFDKDLWVLCHESTLCVGKGEEGSSRVMQENLDALYVLPRAQKGRFVMGNPEAVSSVEFDFDCHDTDWTLKVSDIDKELICLELTGERNYVIYITANNKYELFEQIASRAGYKVPNRPMPAKTIKE